MIVRSGPSLERLRDTEQARAKAIVEVSEDLTAAVNSEVGRVVSLEIGRAIDVLQEAVSRLTIISAAYSAGSLPKVTK